MWNHLDLVVIGCPTPYVLHCTDSDGCVDIVGVLTCLNCIHIGGDMNKDDDGVGDACCLLLLIGVRK